MFQMKKWFLLGNFRKWNGVELKMSGRFDLLISGVSGCGIGMRCCLNYLDCGVVPMLVVCFESGDWV
jgi:hypothetical protein